MYDYPWKKAKSEMWMYLGFHKSKPGPPTKANLDMSKAIAGM